MSDEQRDWWSKPATAGAAYEVSQPRLSQADVDDVWSFTDHDPIGDPVRVDRPRRGRGGVVAATLLLGLVAGGAAGGIAGYVVAERDDDGVHDENASLGTTPATVFERPPDSVAGIAARLLPSVVQINISGGGQSGTGSGFVLRNDGYIATNNHVVAAAGARGAIDVLFSDNSRATAEIVGTDPGSDLAVIKVGASDMPDTATAVALGDSDAVAVGDPVVAIGSPLGLTGSVTAGIVSAKDRAVTAEGDNGSDESFINAIQTDAAINPGNSGGPLVNVAGQVVGVNTAIAVVEGSVLSDQAGNIGVGFAIPVNQARRIAEELIRDGHAERAIIGVTLDSRYSGGDGARILGDGEDPESEPIMPDGPAAAAGLRAGDVIVAVDDRQITDAADLIVAIRSHAPGDTVKVTVRRGDETQDHEITLIAAR